MAKQKTKQKTAEVQEVGTSVKKLPRSEQVRKDILDAFNAIEDNYVHLSKLLAEASDKEFYTEWGYTDFREYCDKDLGIEYRKAMYLVSIWHKAKDLDLNLKEVSKLGWTKMKDIVSVANEKNIKELMDKAKGQTSRETTEMCKTMRSPDHTGRGVVPSIVTMTFRMGESEANIITEAIGEAKKLVGQDNDVLGLEMICQDWMAEKGVSPQVTDLADHIKYLERIYGVTVTTKKGRAKSKDEDEEKEEVEETKSTKSPTKKDVKSSKKPAKSKKEKDEDEDEDGADQDINDILSI